MLILWVIDITQGAMRDYLLNRRSSLGAIFRPKGVVERGGANGQFVGKVEPLGMMDVDRHGL